MQVATENAGDVSQVLAQMRALPEQRLTRIDVQGRSYYVKMAEQHKSLRMRLLKGDPKVAFEREIRLLQGFSERGAPVARIVAAAESRIALADHGTPLHTLINSGQADLALMQALGAALARLHALGLAHGRPSMRDICWNGKDLTFLDLEAGAKLQAQTRDQARDVYLMIHSIFTRAGVRSELAAPVWQGYREHGDAKVVDATQALARRLVWLDLLSRPVVMIDRLRGKTRSESFAIKAARQLILAD